MFSNPTKNLKSFALREDNVVADLGAGTGYYSTIAGTLVPHGKVYAVEISQDFLDTIKAKVKDAHLSNVDIIWGNVEKMGGTKIKDHVVDDVIASNILFQVENKEGFIDEVKRILKPGGRVLLIDWLDSSIMKGVKLMPKDVAQAIFLKKGFKLEREIDAGEHNYGMILRKED